MRTISTPIKIEKAIIYAAENRKIIEDNLEEASVYDYKAAKHLKKGNYEKTAYFAGTYQYCK